MGAGGGVYQKGYNQGGGSGGGGGGSSSAIAAQDTSGPLLNAVDQQAISTLAAALQPKQETVPWGLIAMVVIAWLLFR